MPFYLRRRNGQIKSRVFRRKGHGNIPLTEANPRKLPRPEVFMWCSLGRNKGFLANVIYLLVDC